MGLPVPGVAAAIVAGAAALASCQFQRGPRMAELDPAQAQAIDLIFVGGRASVCVNGGAPQLRAVVTLADGSQLETWSHRESQDGKLPFSEFEWSASTGYVDEAGQLRLPADPFAVIDRDLTVRARVARRPELEATVTATPSFDCGGFAHAGGRSGASGRTGSMGQRGRDGRAGTAQAAATDGEPGTHGQGGGDGAHGGDGPLIEVALGYVETERHGRLILIRVGGVHFLVDPAGEPFVVSAAGGDGGHGGAGGRGGDGGNGGAYTIDDPPGDGGNGGDGGSGGGGGRGGDGGDGGTIRISYTRAHPELPDLVGFSTRGGRGGGAGPGGHGGSGGRGGNSSSGRGGRGGREGSDGPSGAAGRDGRDGAGASAAPADPRELFSAELGAGIPLVVDR